MIITSYHCLIVLGFVRQLVIGEVYRLFPNAPQTVKYITAWMNKYTFQVFI